MTQTRYCGICSKPYKTANGLQDHVNLRHRSCPYCGTPNHKTLREGMACMHRHNGRRLSEEQVREIQGGATT